MIPQFVIVRTHIHTPRFKCDVRFCNVILSDRNQEIRVSKNGAVFGVGDGDALRSRVDGGLEADDEPSQQHANLKGCSFSLAFSLFFR